MNDSDDQLALRYRLQGDRSALSELAVRYLPLFYRTARAMMLSHAQSEDISQEVMLKVIRSIDRFRGNSGFRAWSYTILLNTIRNELRRKRIVSLVSSGEPFTEATDGKVAPDFNSLQQESREQIASAIARLTDHQRTALVLIHIEGLTAAEVAQIEGCSVDSVYQRIAEAKRKLRNDASLRSLWLERG